MTVPTVERGFLEVVFWSIEIAGDNPSIESTSGWPIIPKNWRAYGERDSTYLLCPSAYKVSKASVDLPEPDRPVMTVILPLGISTLMFLRLCCLAPFITIFCCSEMKSPIGVETY